MMISQLHVQYIPKRAPSVLYINVILYPKGTLLVLYYIDKKKKKHYSQKKNAINFYISSPPFPSSRYKSASKNRNVYIL